jgi:Arc/MetJ-type ribon-helix-helix transcriptional regulator
MIGKKMRPVSFRLSSATVDWVDSVVNSDDRYENRSHLLAEAVLAYAYRYETMPESISERFKRVSDQVNLSDTWADKGQN